MPDPLIFLGMCLYWMIIYMIIIQQKSLLMRVVTTVTAAVLLLIAPLVYYELAYEPEPTQAMPGIVGMSYQLKLPEDQPGKEHFHWISTDSTVLMVDPTGVMTFVGEGIARACAENTETPVNGIGSIEVWHMSGTRAKWWEVGTGRGEMSTSGSGRAYTCTIFIVGSQEPPPRMARRGAGTNSVGSRFFYLKKLNLILRRGVV